MDGANNLLVPLQVQMSSSAGIQNALAPAMHAVRAQDIKETGRRAAEGQMELDIAQGRSALLERGILGLQQSGFTQSSTE